MEKTSQARSVGNIISPLSWLGKKYLSSRSDIYKNTLDVVVKADTAFRDIVYKQKNYLKDMKTDKGKLEAVKFAQDVSAFLREQAALVSIVEYMRGKFSEAVGVAPEKLKSVDYYISQQIGRTPEYNPNQIVEKKIDADREWEMERPSSLRRWISNYVGDNNDWARLQTEEEKSAIEKNPDIIAEAFLASWFWGRTKSGKELKAAFDVVYNGILNMFNANLSTLKTLDNLRAKGDAQSYWDASKGKGGFGGNYKRFFENDSFQKAWSKFEEFMMQSFKDEDIKPEEIEQEYKEPEVDEWEEERIYD